jgi:hypothetical protein
MLEVVDAVHAYGPVVALDASDPEHLNVVPCTPAKQLYRGKYTDQTADTPIGPIKLRNWDRAASGVRFTAVAWRADDCVVLPR